MRNMLLATGENPPDTDMVDFLKEFGEVHVFNHLSENSKKNVEYWRDNATCMFVSPVDENMLGKFALGFHDDFITRLFRCWDWTRPVYLFTQMDRHAWLNQPTHDYITTLGHRYCPNLSIPVVNDGPRWLRPKVEHLRWYLTRKLEWKFPLENCAGIPINHHPGAFGFHRRKNHHTGVDLYCKDGDAVLAVEDGTVVKIDYFTGPKLGHDWWEETEGMMVEGPSGVVNYGEITAHCYGAKVGQTVRKGQFLGRVKRVLFEDRTRPDIPGHSTSMLHLELYKHGAREFADWHDPQKNPMLLDPTPFLMAADKAPRVTLTWGNEEGKTAG